MDFQLPQSEIDYLLSLQPSELQGFLQTLEKAKPLAHLWLKDRLLTELYKRSGQKRPKSYERHRLEMAARSRAKSRAGREIGPIPPIHPDFVELRESCRTSLRLFCETFFPAKFYLGWSADHLRVIEHFEQAVLRGGKFALAMPRSSGKTTLCGAAIMCSACFLECFDLSELSPSQFVMWPKTFLGERRLPTIESGDKSPHSKGRAFESAGPRQVRRGVSERAPAGRRRAAAAHGRGVPGPAG